MRDFTGCPNCQSVDPARCYCSPYERLMAQIRLVQAENRALRQELEAYASHSAMPPAPAWEAGHEL